MKKAILSLALASLAACSATPPLPELAQPRSVLPFQYVSCDSPIAVRFQVDTRQSHYDILDHSGKVLYATAQSRIVADDFFEGRFRGTQDVVFASDGSGAVITENVSDASQSFRHILISRKSNDSFTVRYLLPPWRRFTTEPEEFDSEPPIAIGLTSDSIVFYYPSSRSTLTLPISKVPSFASPQSDPNE